MRTTTPFWQGVQATTMAALVLCVVTACNKPAPPPAAPAKPAPPKTNTVATTTANAAVPEHVSVFVEMMPPKGKDPFYPNSPRRNPVPPVKPVDTGTTPKPVEVAAVVLKGILGGGTHKLAVVNNAILEVGESGKVTVPGGSVRVKVLEIGEDYAVVQVEGEAQPKRLLLTKKGL